MRRFFLFIVVLLINPFLFFQYVFGDACPPSGGGGGGGSGLGGASGIFGGITDPENVVFWIFFIFLLLIFGLLGFFFFQRSRNAVDVPAKSFTPPIPPENYCGDARVQQPNGITTTSYFKPGSNPIGRDPGSSIHLNDPKVSNHHADLNVSDSQYILTDLNSSNGTYVNGERITQKNVYKGDQIKIGDSTIIL